MATIEPRLIHLLNESEATPRLHQAELPPINGFTLPKPNGRQHPPPVESDAGQRTDGKDGNGGQSATQSLPSLLSVTDDGFPNSVFSRKDGGFAVDRNLSHHISSQELRSQDIRMILDDTPEISEESSTKKRPVKEDFVQLPQPLKKQKAATPPHMFPPIIVGLLEPPPQTAQPLFPPISSGSFDDRPRSEPPQAPNIVKPPDLKNSTPDKRVLASPAPDSEPGSSTNGKPKRRAAKPRRKWSEEETNHLLLGVSKHGVGRWTDILEDSEYSFNDRSAGDLKDRFRTCCPEELRAGANRKERAYVDRPQVPVSKPKPKKGLMSENILNEPEEDAETEMAYTVQNDDDGFPKQRKSRAHRKKLEDLRELGIKGPFKKSQRRGRRPFSEQDDREILQGFERYGPQWTKIQRDPQFHLSTRQPTDLRDRMRNKYPERFASAEKTTMQVKEPGRGSLLEPCIEMNIENSLNRSKSSVLEPQLNRSSSKEDMPKWPIPSMHQDSSDASQAISGMYWNDSAGTAMDIARLIIEDTTPTQEGMPSSQDKRGLG
ncbi:MYB DNA-binding domain-containing protein [Apiospora phragmitis]|uniref:MYB DNA-binding domain-containing protein n=1 Tax=Apiospora phragmitis TaxID=2905665 RepID=A0ABR1UT97_9PEZI